MIKPEDYASEQARHELLGLVKSLQNVGLGGERYVYFIFSGHCSMVRFLSCSTHRRIDLAPLFLDQVMLTLKFSRFQTLFAEIMNNSMTEYVYLGCRGFWSSEDSNPEQGVRDRPVSHREKGSILLTQQLIIICHLAASQVSTTGSKIVTLNLQSRSSRSLTMVSIASRFPGVSGEWKEMSIGHLAALRTSELFDIVVNWPNSPGALDDLELPSPPLKDDYISRTCLPRR